MLDTSSVDTIDPFTRSGLTPEQLQDFFAAAAKAGEKRRRRRSRYAVSKAFHALNGPLVVDEYLNKLHALDASDLQRARAFVDRGTGRGAAKPEPVAPCVEIKNFTARSR